MSALLLATTAIETHPDCQVGGIEGDRGSSLSGWHRLLARRIASYTGEGAGLRARYD